MATFNPYTGNLYNVIFDQNGYILEDPQGERKEIDDENSIIEMSGMPEDSTYAYKYVIQKLEYNPIARKKKYPCPNCDRKIVNMIMLSNNGNPIYKCLCGYKF